MMCRINLLLICCLSFSQAILVSKSMQIAKEKYSAIKKLKSVQHHINENVGFLSDINDLIPNEPKIITPNVRFSSKKTSKQQDMVKKIPEKSNKKDKSSNDLSVDPLFQGQHQEVSDSDESNFAYGRATNTPFQQVSDLYALSMHPDAKNSPFNYTTPWPIGWPHPVWPSPPLQSNIHSYLSPHLANFFNPYASPILYPMWNHPVIYPYNNLMAHPVLGQYNFNNNMNPYILGGGSPYGSGPLGIPAAVITSYHNIPGYNQVLPPIYHSPVDILYGHALSSTIPNPSNQKSPMFDNN